MPTIQIADKPTLDNVSSLVDNFGFYNDDIIKDDTIKCKREIYPFIPVDMGTSSSIGNCIIYKDEIHSIGCGSLNKDWVDHYKWNGRCWEKIATLSEDTRGGIALVWNDKIHVFYDNKHHRFDETTNTWEVLEDTIPFEFVSTSGVVYNNEIHLIDEEYHYKWDGTSWTKASTLPYDTRNYSTVVYNNEIHILGGNNSSYGLYHYKWDGTSWTSVSTLPFSSKFSSSCALVYDNCIYACGANTASTSGYSFYKWDGTSWIYVYDILYNKPGEQDALIFNEKLILLPVSGVVEVYDETSRIFSLNTTMPYDFYDGYAVVYNDEIHILGGYNNKRSHYRYNKDSDDWVSVSTLPYPFSDASAIVYNNEIHIMGSDWTNDTTDDSGNKVSYKRAHSKWDGTSWTRLEDIPYKSDRYYNVPSIVYNDEIYLFGQYDGDKPYKFDGTSWVSSDIKGRSAYNCISIVYKGEIHLLGTDKYNNTNNKSHYKYDFDTNTWINLSNLPGDISFSNDSAVVYNEELYLLINEKAMYKYNDELDTWIEMVEIFDTRYAVVYEDEIHLLGGYDPSHMKYDGEKLYIAKVISDISINNPHCNAIKYRLKEGSKILCDSNDIEVIPYTEDPLIFNNNEYEIAKDDTVYLIPKTSDKSKLIYTII